MATLVKMTGTAADAVTASGSDPLSMRRCRQCTSTTPTAKFLSCSSSNRAGSSTFSFSTTGDSDSTPPSQGWKLGRSRFIGGSWLNSAAIWR